MVIDHRAVVGQKLVFNDRIHVTLNDTLSDTLTHTAVDMTKSPFYGRQLPRHQTDIPNPCLIRLTAASCESFSKGTASAAVKLLSTVAAVHWAHLLCQLRLPSN